MMSRAFFLFVLSLTVIGCSDNSTSNTSPSPTVMTVDGTWKTNVSVQGQSAVMTWVLNQSGTAASGPATVSLPNGSVLLNGFVNGTVSNATATAATLAYTVTVGTGGIPSQPTCAGQFGGTMTAAAAATTTMTGDFSVKSSTCAAPFSNTTLTMTRQ